MCQDKWNTASEFKSSAASAGVNVQYAGIGFGLSGADASSDSKITEARDKYCSMDSKQYLAEYSTKASSVTTDAAVNAWSECVNNALAIKKQGVFVKIVDDPSYKDFHLELIYYSTAGKPLELISLLATSSDVNVSCQFGGDEIKPSAATPYKFPTGAVTIHCTKDKPLATLVSLTLVTPTETFTGIRTGGSIPTPSDLEALSADVKALQAQLISSETKLRGQLVGLSSELIKQDAKIGSKLREVNVQIKQDSDADGSNTLTAVCPNGMNRIGHFCSNPDSGWSVRDVDTNTSISCIYTNNSGAQNRTYIAGAVCGKT